ncbi:hypothetical protein ANN_25241 [Periplaneta americana]|uniref:Uncharacterized protein n=1 Tax=Periplaneta americana TaxID=6978 RepID=A0ABQ8S0X3_PERAM|nr:hypothetical protein ANN_25241 [Periplaneta americana]
MALAEPLPARCVCVCECVQGNLYPPPSQTVTKETPEWLQAVAGVQRVESNFRSIFQWIVLEGVAEKGRVSHPRYKSTQFRVRRAGVVTVGREGLVICETFWAVERGVE